MPADGDPNVDSEQPVTLDAAHQDNGAPAAAVPAESPQASVNIARSLPIPETTAPFGNGAPSSVSLDAMQTSATTVSQ